MPRDNNADIFAFDKINEAIFELEAVEGLEIVDIHNIGKYNEEKPFIIIETKTRIFWYDEKRKYLLGE